MSPLVQWLQGQGRFLDSLAVLCFLTATDRLSDRFRALLPVYAADAAVGLGDLAQAMRLLVEAIGIQEQLASRDPSNAEWQRDLAISFMRVAQALPEDQATGAGEMFQRGLGIMVELANTGRLAPPDVAWLEQMLQQLQDG